MGKLQKFANKAGFFFYLRLHREEIVNGFRKWIEDYGMERMKETINRGEFPDVAPDLFTQASDYLEYLEGISVEYLAELIAEAVPEIAEHLIYMGPEGGVYLAKLRLHFLELCRHPDQAPVVDTPLPSGENDVASIICDKCNKAFAIKKSEFSKLEKCPICGAAANN